MIKILLMLVPHFITDRVALYYAEDETIQVLCREDEVNEGNEYLVIFYGTISTWTWFNICAGGKVIIDE